MDNYINKVIEQMQEDCESFANIEWVKRILTEMSQLSYEAGQQSQQAKVEELQLASQVLIHNLQIFMKSERELQKRVDAVTHLIRGLRAEFDLWMDVECPQVERQIELLEQALKGEG
ncbi:hypothetical protein H2788_14330 [Acinetobacter seifertii]|uniref:hypothetical protein n=1 Tax=Acinetobacter seifertii TaxID=1530123 RepID=UPI00321AE455